MKNRYLEYISHGIYLQIFIGIGLILPALLGMDLPGFMTRPITLAGMFVGLGMNSLVYINKYKKSLKE